ncbi:MAG: 3-phosphoshikimate 1-carboxyvinyltransferase [Gemmatimonadetes bacterium]|nr:3-phosphoshikimate 1-carboxyvinyltransferase [Gemmatimonadota bacterium]
MKLRIDGEIEVPGDKSISHRALLLATLAHGESRLQGVLPGADCRSTAAALRALGCTVPVIPADGGELRINGRGVDAWAAPAEPIDCGNSGTTTRLLLGLLASRPFCCTLTGDESLRSRPMRRVTEPLAAMGASIRDLAGPDRLPLEICGGPLRGLHHHSAKASAQVKSAVLLAGLSGGVEVSVLEPSRSRDHTERMLSGMGADVRGASAENGWQVRLTPSAGPLRPLDLSVPGDPSSAAFWVALCLLADAGELRILNVCVNPTRTGFLSILARMGARVKLENQRLAGGEPVADLTVAPSELRGTSVSTEEIPAAVDEIPILAVLAARAQGETRVVGAGELRVKESDRIAAVVSNLQAVGVDAEELPEGLVVQGSDRPLSGRVHTRADHRIAMAFGVLGALPGNHIEIDSPDVVDVSFPGFWSTLRQLSSGTSSLSLKKTR